MSLPKLEGLSTQFFAILGNMAIIYLMEFLIHSGMGVGRVRALGRITPLKWLLWLSEFCWDRELDPVHCFYSDSHSFTIHCSGGGFHIMIYSCVLCMHRIAQHPVIQQSVRRSQAAVIR